MSFCKALQRFAIQIAVKLMGSHCIKALIKTSTQQHQGWTKTCRVWSSMLAAGFYTPHVSEFNCS